MRKLLPVLLLVGIVALANEFISLPASIQWNRLTVEGVAPGASWAQIEERLGKPGERTPSGSWRWPAREVELSLQSGRAFLRGAHLEVGGQVMGRASEPASRVLRQLGPPDDWGQRCGVGTQAAVAYVCDGKQLRIICQGASNTNKPSCCDPAAQVVAFELSWFVPSDAPAPNF